MSKSGQCSGGVKHRYRHFRKYRSDNSSFLQRTSALPHQPNPNTSHETYLAERKQDPQKESRRLIQCLLQSIIQMNIQFPSVHLHILPHSIKEDTFQKDSDFIRFQIRDKDLCTGIRCVRGPFGRLGQCDELSPVWKRR